MTSSSLTQKKLCYDIKPEIAVGETTSNAVEVFGTTLLAFITDANLTATSFTFLVSDAIDGTFVPLKDMSSGTSLQASASTSSQYATQPSDFASVQFIKFVANTNQLTNPSVITLVTRTIA